MRAALVAAVLPLSLTLAPLTLVPLTLVPSAAADPVPDLTPSPPFIDYTQWVGDDGWTSLQVYPTASGRSAAGQLGKTPAQIDEAWGEVLALAPDADTPGMRSQFVCHWRLAEFAEPGKASWNLEPWRPVVDDNTMLLDGCNPGGGSDS